MLYSYDLSPVRARYESDMNRLADRYRSDRQWLHRICYRGLRDGNEAITFQYGYRVGIMQMEYERHQEMLTAAFRSSLALYVGDKFAQLAGAFLRKARAAKGRKIARKYLQQKVNTDFNRLVRAKATTAAQYVAHFEKFKYWYDQFEDGVQ